MQARKEAYKFDINKIKGPTQNFSQKLQKKKKMMKKHPQGEICPKILDLISRLSSIGGPKLGYGR